MLTLSRCIRPLPLQKYIGDASEYVMPICCHSFSIVGDQRFGLSGRATPYIIQRLWQTYFDQRKEDQEHENERVNNNGYRGIVVKLKFPHKHLNRLPRGHERC